MSPLTKAASWTQERLDWLAARDRRIASKRGRTLGEALLDGPAVVRIEYVFDRGGRRVPHLTAWSANHHRVRLGEQQEAAILAEVHARHPLTDWRVDHDYDLRDGSLHAAPDVMDNRGGIPEHDRCFGELPPVYLPTPTSPGATT